MGLTSFVLEAGFWVLKRLFNWFGANEEQRQWLAQAAKELHKKGWAREKIIMDLDEKQNERLNQKMDELLKEEKPDGN